MTTPVIIDIIVAAVLLGFTAYGARRGLLQTMAGLVIVVVALVGAGIIAATFSGPAAKLVAPAIENAALEEQAKEHPMQEADVEADWLEDLLERLGMDRDVRESMAKRAGETVRDTGVSIAAAVVESIASSFIYGILYILSFALLLLLLHVLVGAMGLVFKLPGLRGLNALGGGLLGLIEGALLLFLAVWVLRRLGVSFETETLAEAHILRIFTTNTPLSVLSFLQ